MSQLPVAGYYRVSQARDGMHAPELYEDEVRRYCSFRKLRLGETFADIDRSGYNNSEKRPALNELLARRAEFSAVVVPKLSRFGRSLKHLIELFDVFDTDGISLVFLDMNIDTSSSQGRLLRHIMAAFAEYESDVKADYARANYRHAMRHGRVWGQPPFGYRSMNKRYVIVHEEALVIRRIFTRYLEGATLYRIVIELNADGIRGRQGGRWGPSRIGRILDNPVYAGLTSLDGELYDAKWDAIIDRPTWDEVQRQRLPNNRGQRVRKAGTGGPYLLSGLIVCGTCGSNAHYRQNKPSHNYRCFHYVDGATCKGGGVTQDRAERIVVEQVLSRVRFSIEGASFATSEEAWDKASLEQRRRVLAAVLDRVVIEPRPKGVRRLERTLRLEWKPAFDSELVVTPLERAVAPKQGKKRNRAERHRSDCAAKRSRDLGASTRAYYKDWGAVRRRLIPNLTRGK